MNILVDYIKTHPNWRTELAEKPYCISIKDDGPYTLFSYSQIDSDMSLPLVQICRGIILKNADTSPKVVCYPFSKFFNYSEPNAHPIDWASAKIQSKIDGSIIKVFFDEGWHVSTNGMIDAFKAELQFATNEFKSFGDLFMIGWKNSTPFDFDHLLSKDYTSIFELVSPFNRVVVPYKEITLYTIGCRNNLTEQEHPFTLPSFNAPKLYSFATFEDMIESTKTLPYSEEGYVVVDKNFNRIKVKGIEYVACHRLKGEAFSDKRAIELALIGEGSEFLSYFPEYKPIVDRASAAINSIKSYLLEKQEELSSRSFETQKDFALFIKDWKYTGFFFGYRSGKIKSVEEYLQGMDSKEIAKYM